MESLALVEPLLPAEGNRTLTDLATQLWVESTALSSNLYLATIRGWEVPTPLYDLKSIDCDYCGR
jgi:hypothetical protein